MTLNIAMLATGRIADNELAPALAKAAGAQLWSVLSRDRARAAEFGKRHGAAAPRPAHDSLDALLADPKLDAVIIASPDKLHAAQAIACAKAGKHVLCEKPMVTERSEGRAMIDACRSAGVKLGVAYHIRWHEGHRALHARVQQGDLGELRHMRLHWAFRAPDASNWRASTEVGRWWGLAGVGTHCLDQIRWFMVPTCGEVKRLQSLVTNAVFGSPNDETAVLAMEFESGATAELCTSVLFGGPRRMELYGSQGHALCENTLGPVGDGRIDTHSGPLSYSVRNPYVGEIEDFVAAVKEDREPEVGGEEGLRNVEMLLQAVE